MVAKQYALDKRFSASFSDRAYEQSCPLNVPNHLPNNHLLTVLLGCFEAFANADKLKTAVEAFIGEYGALNGAMAKK